MAKSHTTATSATVGAEAVLWAANDLPDELWTKLNIEFCKDASYAIFKSLTE
jgi:hypothetical protein